MKRLESSIRSCLLLLLNAVCRISNHCAPGSSLLAPRLLLFAAVNDVDERPELQQLSSLSTQPSSSSSLRTAIDLGRNQARLRAIIRRLELTADVVVDLNQLCTGVTSPSLQHPTRKAFFVAFEGTSEVQRPYPPSTSSSVQASSAAEGVRTAVVEASSCCVQGETSPSAQPASL